MRIEFLWGNEMFYNYNTKAHNSGNILKTIKLYTLNGYVGWSMNYVSLKLFKKEQKLRN